MLKAYRCPSCKAKSRFNVIEQVAKSVKFNPDTNQYLLIETLEPYHLPYNGPEKRVQCGSCGVIEDEIRFVKAANYES
ncbi:hypothetical protein [Thalassobacillus sp. C254]|uniref:hypothetical protein n=1 Tax=Thalassobacillus sp. C254 TaxID=1225341 RepID=UPI0006D243B2|nr:hypothetical protein [Thalassobacillus sp. C254]